MKFHDVVLESAIGKYCIVRSLEKQYVHSGISIVFDKTHIKYRKFPRVENGALYSTIRVDDSLMRVYEEHVSDSNYDSESILQCASNFAAEVLSYVAENLVEGIFHGNMHITYQRLEIFIAPKLS